MPIHNPELITLRKQFYYLLDQSLKQGYPIEDIFSESFRLTTNIKINQRMRDISVDKIQKIEKETIESIKAIFISEKEVPGKKILKELDLYDEDPDTLITFPCYDQILLIVDKLKSKECHIFVTRSGNQILYDIRQKYYILEKGHWSQLYFPFEEGITYSDLFDDNSLKRHGMKVPEIRKIPEERPMVITIAHKSGMTTRQLVNSFILDPKEAEERLEAIGQGEYRILYFLGDKDREGRTWCNKLDACIDDALADPKHACPAGPEMMDRTSEFESVNQTRSN